MKLILVRHAMPAIAPQIRPEHWELDDSGRAAATYLARFLPARATLVSSMEPKAYQTLVPSGPVTQDAGLNEVERDEPFDGALGLTPWRPGDDGRPPAEALGEDFRARRRSYVEGTDHPGWEPRAEVVSRFDAAVRRYPDGSVFASHGMAMTLWLTARVGLPDPGAFWADLRLPDAFEVDLEARTVSCVVSPGFDFEDLILMP